MIIIATIFYLKRKRNVKREHIPLAIDVELWNDPHYHNEPAKRIKMPVIIFCAEPYFPTILVWLKQQ